MAVAIVTLLSSCSLSGGANNPTNTSANPAPSASVNADTVNIQNFSFVPATLTIKKGTTVTWTNNDPVTHQLKSITFNSGLLSKGQNFSFTFNESGTFDYSCAIHPAMLGKIIVE